ncbi:MAG TPA: sigma 54-interacting transcriptional regulator [Bacteroidota bacterium]|jgi:DNA-binding NtrC family response regulator|nr:sigma 54-interacting transcriptional regulator [Bacteroidota bacterium]
MDQIIGKSSVAKKLQKEIQRLGKAQKHVVIQGDKGTGKTTVAHLLHEHSKREGKLVILNPTAATDDDVRMFFERETKSVATLVVRDIQDFSFLYQSKLERFLHSLPERPFLQVIVTASDEPAQLRNNRKLINELHDAIEKFEEIYVPPLRERREDIPVFIEHFMKAACESMNMQLKVIDVNILDFLVRREWTGNVAELKSVIESTVFTSRDGAVELPESLVNEQVQLESILKNINLKKAFSFDGSLSNLEKTLIEKTLGAVDNNQTRAAEILNLSEANLRYRLRKFHILASRKK